MNSILTRPTALLWAAVLGYLTCLPASSQVADETEANKSSVAGAAVSSVKHLSGDELPYAIVLEGFYDTWLQVKEDAHYHGTIGFLRELGVDPESKRHKVLSLYASRYKHEIVANQRFTPGHELASMTQAAKRALELSRITNTTDALRALHEEFMATGVFEPFEFEEILNRVIRPTISMAVVGGTDEDVAEEEQTWRALDALRIHQNN